MAQCAAIDTNGALVAVTEDPCTALVILTPAELETLRETSFAFPTGEAASQAFAWAFTLVVGSYCIGWACGAVLNQFRGR